MTTFARIINSVAVDVSSAPAEHFHPSIAAEFVAVPSTVVPGSRLVDGEWIAPEVAPESEPAPVYPQVSPVEFKLLFTSPERVAIKAARASDPVVDDFYDIVEDPRLTFVDLGLQSTQDAIGYMATHGLIAPERVAVILSGAVV